MFGVEWGLPCKMDAVEAALHGGGTRPMQREAPVYERRRRRSQSSTLKRSAVGSRSLKAEAILDQLSGAVRRLVVPNIVTINDT